MKQNYWAERIADKILQKNKGEIVLETGITPSGPYHIGHLREMIATDAVCRALEKRGAKTRFIYFIDDLDNLRKLYPFLPGSYEKYVHCPISKIPSPDGKAPSYAEYFLAPFKRALKTLGISVDFLFGSDYYESGKMTDLITTAFEKKDEIAEILSRVSHRQLPEGWQPFEALDETTGKIRDVKILEVDTKNTRVKYVAEDGSEKWADYSKGQGKLPWRIDWPARWALLNIAFEPFGKEHGAAGGSYDVGREISEKIYKHPAPEYIIYEHIYLKGEAKKMSASLGNLISLDDYLQVVPPEVARYSVLRSKNERHLVFDPGVGLMHLTDEYARLEEDVISGKASSAEKSLYEYSQISEKRATVSVPFSHLVNVVQAAQGDFEEIKRLLEKTGHIAAIENEKDLKAQICRVAKWLELYAPEEVKFEVQKEAPKIDVNSMEQEVLKKVASAIKQDKTGIDLHNAIYEAGKSAGLKPRDTFRIIYRIFLDKDSGPKAGFFLSMLDKDFVIARINNYSN